MLEAVDTLWRRIFSDISLSRRQRIHLERYTIAVLSGLASSQLLQGSNPIPPEPEIALLKQSILMAMRPRSA
jgi:hypothetical protein